eukprot:1139698-Pelagomonas_calceolata.AAC.3
MQSKGCNAMLGMDLSKYPRRLGFHEPCLQAAHSLMLQPYFDIAADPSCGQVLKSFSRSVPHPHHEGQSLNPRARSHAPSLTLLDVHTAHCIFPVLADPHPLCTLRAPCWAPSRPGAWQEYSMFCRACHAHTVHSMFESLLQSTLARA